MFSQRLSVFQGNLIPDDMTPLISQHSTKCMFFSWTWVRKQNILQKEQLVPSFPVPISLLLA